MATQANINTTMALFVVTFKVDLAVAVLVNLVDHEVDLFGRRVDAECVHELTELDLSDGPAAILQ